MQRGIEERRQRTLSAVAVSALLALVSSACGRHVVIAEQVDSGPPVTTRSKADVDGGDAEHVSFIDQGNFMCGHSRCTNHPGVIGNVPLNGYACCFDAKRSACGVVLVDTCIPLDAPGHLDTTCTTSMSPPAGQLAALFGVLPGCCTPQGTCGSLESNIGIGCIQIPGLSTFANCDYNAGADP